MIFNEVTYFIAFLLPCVLVFHLGPGWLRPWVLATFGLLFFVFYGAIHFGGAWGALCALIFVWELITSRLYRERSIFCILGIIQAVAILIVFKYTRFFAVAWNDMAGLVGGLPLLDGPPPLVFPLGLSFFTFEFIHFAVDSYRGKTRDAPLGSYAAFIFFFPSMVAGPLKRYQEFASELGHARFNAQQVQQGVTRILAGLVKKHVFADTFALWADQLNTAAALSADRLSLVGWLLAYGMKIYFDFSAYSDIAIGSGYLFGIAIPENFNWPYLSRNISEFWRRWHISLGRWIFDYIYAPLGGSRRGEWRTSLNLVATFAVSGLWHGAAYNFVVWGLWHGLLMVGHRSWSRFSEPRGLRIPAFAAQALTFTCVIIGWAFFCMEFGQAWHVLSRIAGVA
ncbi:MBOAT family protein [Archangium minus]|uniref:MBOAT family protein n=1 Tax=Archangium minus TaxID=83450 RepID=A0ABY9WL11_9BACT|nr:MBOAT family protein [Archangium violaceum]WNG44300.1 MBOAT family protein [Archangium minus]